MRRFLLLALAALAATALLIPSSSSGVKQVTVQDYVVLYKSAADRAAARAAIARIGGTVVKENTAVGLATVHSANANFVVDAGAQAALYGAARNRPIGQVAPTDRAKFSEERLDAERKAARGTARAATSLGSQGTSGGTGFEPFAPLQWDMSMIHATKYESQQIEPGRKGVRVGIIDTGIDASHPDIAPNFDSRLSRNFTTDIPLIDGPCSDEPDHSCADPANVDEDGHGTHVAGTVAAAVNGLGISGIAPNVTLVNLRAGQDSGYFFLQPSVDALTFAGQHGIDVVNMSYYIDPWLYNCRHNPADSPEAQEEQRTIIAATERALRYAHSHGVTLVSALGNENTDIGHPKTDDTSPDFPPDTAYHRDVDNGCLSMPTEGPHVIGVSAVGPSTAKSDYSNWGTERTQLAAPGGWYRDYFGTPRFMSPENLILSTYAENVGREVGDIDQNGNPTNPFVLENCANGTCGYYTYFQGTSMASPHVVGVAALIVSEYGKHDHRHGGLELDPDKVERILEHSASEHACPDPRLFSYVLEGRTPDYDAYCDGSPRFNGFYGHGIVNAYDAVLGGEH
jgi:subtilisin family serine protease